MANRDTALKDAMSIDGAAPVAERLTGLLTQMNGSPRAEAAP